MPSKTYAVNIKEWEVLTATVAANAAELPQMEIHRAALEKTLEEMRKLLAQQALHRSNKQQTSVRLRALAVEGERLATLLRGSLKQHWGIRNEKLAEFGLLPFRGRAPKAEKKPPEPPADPSTDPSSNSAA